MSAVMWHALRQGKAIPYYAMLQFQRVEELFSSAHTAMPTFRPSLPPLSQQQSATASTPGVLTITVVDVGV
jgi:hypothetical protein